MKTDHPVLPYLLLALAASTWGGNIALGRFMHGDIPPLTLTFFRWAVALIVVIPITWRKFVEDLPVIKRHWKWMLMASATGVAIFHSFIYMGLSSTTAVNAGLMMATSPIVIPVVAYLVHRDKLTGRQAIGLVALVLGVGFIITRGDLNVLSNLTFNTGDLWILAAVPNWALYSVLLKDRPAGLSSRALVLTITAIGTVLLTPFYFWELSTVGGFDLNSANLLTIAYVSVVASVIAYFAWNKGVAAVGAIKAGPFLHMIPVVAMLLGIVFLGETLQAFHFLGMAMIASGILLTAMKPRATS